MRQGWIQIIGLALDISGFMLIVCEWWIAVIKERAIELAHAAHRYEQIAGELSSATPNGALGQRLMDLVVTQLQQEKDKALTRAQQLAEHNPVLVFRVRLRNFLTGAALVVLGFLFQVLSAVPGGITSVGIIP